jgi:biopolymer transport protein ExbB
VNTEAKLSVFEEITKFFQDGGIFMYPIVVVLAIGIAIAFERYIYLSASKSANRRLMGKILPVLQRGDYKQAFSMTAKSNHAVGRMLSQGLSRYKTANHRDDIEAAMEESMMEAIPRLEKRTPYLATFANIATLLGLLGTIIGLIFAFDAVAEADAATKAAKLSDSISKAMNTTAFGLMVAIPLLLIHAILQTKTTQIVDSLEMATTKFVNLMMQRKSSKSAS